MYKVEEMNKVDRARAGSSTSPACRKKPMSAAVRSSGLARICKDGNDGKLGGDDDASGNNVMIHC